MSIRKKLGQNFLNSKLIAKFIVDSAKISKNNIVYEIGIGKGILTPFLCEKSKSVISVEKDYHLYEESKQKFSNIKNENAKKLMLTSVIYLTFIQLTFLFDKIF